MNIFYLDRDPKVSAKAMTDKHVVKMILESAQLMSTAHHEIDKENAPANIYKSTHINHPSAVWVRQSQEHYEWLYEHYIALCDEYAQRYNKMHKTDRELSHVLKSAPKKIPKKFFIEPSQAMPNIYRCADSVHAYRYYYVSEKLKNSKDTERFMKILYEDRL